jgi:hypothetical protein
MAVAPTAVATTGGASHAETDPVAGTADSDNGDDGPPGYHLFRPSPPSDGVTDPRTGP